MTATKSSQAKVLLSAYACEPGQGSEQGVGWNWVQQIARFHEVWVLTRANNRRVIEHALAQEPLPHVHWVYFDLPTWARFWKKGPRGMRLYYHLWQLGTYLVSKRLHAEVRFDVIHKVTFGTYWLPSFLPFLPVPFLWGPLGGGESAPPEFYQTFSLRGRVYERLRDLARWTSEKNPLMRTCAQRTTIALAKTPETATRVRMLGANRVQLFPESGITRDELVQLNLPIRTRAPFRLVSIGNLLHLKGFHLGLNAFARFQHKFPASEYWLIGDGPERRTLMQLAQELGVAHKVRFCGQMPRQRVLEQLAECDVLVHPSLHDSGGWVCLEAMAARRPVLCLDLGGPAVQITEETGFKVPAHAPEQAITALTEAMERLARDADLRQTMGNAARQRVQEGFEWNVKGEQIRSLYESLSDAAQV
jgi:glycosyltransferase involved in cell wall biosynthesis